MIAKLIQKNSPLNQSDKINQLLVILPKQDKLSGKTLNQHSFYGKDTLEALLLRRKMKSGEICGDPVSANLENGSLCAWVIVDLKKPVFEQQACIRKALKLLLDEGPKVVQIGVYGNAKEKRKLAELAVFVTWVNGAMLPSRKTNKGKPSRNALAKIILYGYKDASGFTLLRSKAEGNILSRELTVLPPNELTPDLYCSRIKKLAKSEGWKYEKYDLKKLRKIGAGAFVAVAQGSDSEDAGIVHLQRRVKGSDKTVALVGKGICFDTGGHNLKPARYMYGMHEDMNGSAVALGIFLAATRANLDVNIDCWLAIAQNHIGPRAYKQNDVVTALNGDTIEIINTDAEGRMVLADTLSLATKKNPDVVIDFATLTGTMWIALGSRYSGIFSNNDNLTQQAVDSGKLCGERVVAFPMDSDYKIALKSTIADIKQCSMEPEADHILAALFLSRFAGKTPWIHMDLSASRNTGGLGAVGSDVTGFGVGWGLQMIQTILKNK
jgi:leucyl aminopeptidase